MLKGWNPNTVTISTRCSRGSAPAALFFPALDADLDLIGEQSPQWRKRLHIGAKDEAGNAQVAMLHGGARAAGLAAPLPVDRQVGPLNE
jgi:hypothetical protein